jgi:chorismate synthase
MAGNSLGKLFCVTTYGESHGPAMGVIIDGCPPGIELTEDMVNVELARRRPGQSAIVSQRKEQDQAIILSGVYEGITTGTPISIQINNEDPKSKDYKSFEKVFRPSHADYTYMAKYGFRDHRGGGRASARETVARVAAGAVAKRILLKEGIEIFSYVQSVGNIFLEKEYQNLDLNSIDAHEVRCPDAETAKQMFQYIQEVKKNGDSIGGTIFTVVKGCPVGLGAPVFDKLHADIGKAILSINACKGIEFGSGFEGAKMLGSEHNDVFSTNDNKVFTLTNHSGGIQGGISNGMDITFRSVFKPVATIIKEQDTIDTNFNKITFKGVGRHDPCVLPRAVPIVDSMTAIVLVDHFLRNLKLKK